MLSAIAARQQYENWSTLTDADRYRAALERMRAVAHAEQQSTYLVQMEQEFYVRTDATLQTHEVDLVVAGCNP